MHTIQKAILALAEEENIGAYGLRKLGEKIGVDHPQKVKWHLQKLIKDGYVYRQYDGSLHIAQESTDSSMIAVPILGLANCGQPLSIADEATGELDTLQLSPSLVSGKKSVFAVQATGDSMNCAKIGSKAVNEGDFVLVDTSNCTPNSGQYVVASIDGLATVKKIVHDSDNGVIALVSESTRPRPPIIIDEQQADNFIIHGTAIQVVPSYQ